MSNFVFQISQHGLTFTLYVSRTDFGLSFTFPSKPFLFSHFLLILQSVLECSDADTDNQPDGGKSVTQVSNWRKLILLLVFSIKDLDVFMLKLSLFFEAQHMLCFWCGRELETVNSEVDTSDYLIGDLDLVIAWVW